jgi:beta-glucosidase
MFGSITRPVKELKAYQKIYLEPGESARVRFEIPAQELAFIGPNMQPVVEPGSFRVWIAPNSQEGLQGSFVVLPDGA